MTRVSEALARAAQGPSGTVPSAETPQGMSMDAAHQLWPSEDSPAAPSAVPDGVPERETPLATPTRAPEPVVSAPMEQPRNAGLSQEKLVTGERPETASVEQYRRLAARLHVAQSERGTRVVMITSAVASEGKTLTAANLALTLSESYNRRVLLIDADLRRPWVHELFKVPNVTGLNDGIRADSDRKVPLIRMSEHLSILTAGRPDPDPMSVLVSDRMRRVLADASRSFDWVIVDTPPVAVLSDAHLLATLVDTVVLVIKAGSTQLPQMKRAVEAVGRDRILGVLLNCANDGKQPAYYYSSYENRVEHPAAT